MPVGLIVATVLASGVFVAYGRFSNDRFWILVGTLLLAGPAYAIARKGLDPGRLFSGLGDVALGLGLLILAAPFAADVVGLPRPVAIRLGLGLRNAPGKFDHGVWEVSELWRAAMTRAREQPEERPADMATAEAQVRRLRALPPPNRDWAALRDDIADDEERWMALVRADASAERAADHIAASAPVMGRWQALRDQWSADLALMHSPAVRRRRTIVTSLAYGLGGLLIWTAFLGNQLAF